MIAQRNRHDSHSDGNAIRDLLQDDRVGSVRYPGVDFDTAIDGAGMHYQNVGFSQSQTFFS
jgi:hypothetical protein